MHRLLYISFVVEIEPRKETALAKMAMLAI